MERYQKLKVRERKNPVMEENGAKKWVDGVSRNKIHLLHYYISFKFNQTATLLPML